MSNISKKAIEDWITEELDNNCWMCGHFMAEAPMCNITDKRVKIPGLTPVPCKLFLSTLQDVLSGRQFQVSTHVIDSEAPGTYNRKYMFEYSVTVYNR